MGIVRFHIEIAGIGDIGQQIGCRAPSAVYKHVVVLSRISRVSTGTGVTGAFWA